MHIAKPGIMTPQPPARRFFYKLLTQASMPHQLTRVNKPVLIDLFSMHYKHTIFPVVTPVKSIVNNFSWVFTKTYLSLLTTYN